MEPYSPYPNSQIITFDRSSHVPVWFKASVIDRVLFLHRRWDNAILFYKQQYNVFLRIIV